jgi:hypothetical protein
MTKLLVQPKGDPCSLLDMQTGDEVQPFRPSVVTKSGFIVGRAAAGVIKVIADGLPAKATDEEFQKYWKEAHAAGKDGKALDPEDAAELAVESFMSQFGNEKEVKAPTKRQINAAIKKLTEDEIAAATDGIEDEDKKTEAIEAAAIAKITAE